MHRRERSEKLRCSSSHTANQMWADWCVCVCERESDSIVLTSRSFLTEKQVSRPSHVRLPAMPRMRRGIQVKRVIAAAAHTHKYTLARAHAHTPRVRLPLPWLRRRMLQKRPSEAENHHGVRNRELLGGREKAVATRRGREQQPITWREHHRDA